ncbi:hypothetical protein [Streptacidiphilus jiangxiensis]|uniref:Uncharacterized protein n=1 Tax=Streptacidiphilus jiangxiensis TaxID=235985 RepID=A0A1H7FT18_STRJI|nr:hypothetical protein [Streptacidiphilus jiangxiensis]SEK29118.1 hypothetical protein SAMN05414137_101392 [Streptacidiphilus jiangxiensis]
MAIIWYGVSEHEATWEDAAKWAQDHDWTLANVSAAYLPPLRQALNEMPGLRGDESFWVGRWRGRADPGVNGWYYVHGDGDHWANRGLAVGLDPDPRTARRFVYQYEVGEEERQARAMGRG